MHISWNARILYGRVCKQTNNAIINSIRASRSICLSILSWRTLVRVCRVVGRDVSVSWRQRVMRSVPLMWRQRRGCDVSVSWWQRAVESARRDVSVSVRVSWSQRAVTSTLLSWRQRAVTSAPLPWRQRIAPLSSHDVTMDGERLCRRSLYLRWRRPTVFMTMLLASRKTMTATKTTSDTTPTTPKAMADGRWSAMV